MIDTVKCQECGADIVVDKPTPLQFKAAMAKTKFCAACLKRHKYASIKRYKAAERVARQNSDLPTWEEVDRGYKLFWAKRGIDIDKYTKWGEI